MIADIDGVEDGLGKRHGEIIAGSGGYFLHAMNYQAVESTGFPRMLGGWIISSSAVADLDAAVAALHADGIETGTIADCAAGRPGLRVCVFNDPEGNRLELMQGYRDQG